MIKVTRKSLKALLVTLLAFSAFGVTLIALGSPTVGFSGASGVSISEASTRFVPPDEEMKVTGWDSDDGSGPTPFKPRTYGPLEIEKVESTSHSSDFVYVLIHNTLWSDPDINSRIIRYETDVEATGYGVVIAVYISGSPEFVRSWIDNERDTLIAEGDDLVGCLLVGDIPAAWFEIDQTGDWPPHEEFPIDLFYMDLDGTWTDDEPDGLYDDHTGDVAPEIWVGRLKADAMHDPEDDLIENYFDKNHDYRTGSLSLPQRALVYVDDDWAPGGGVSNDVGKAYSTRTLVDGPSATTNAANYMGHIADQYSFVHLMCHGSPPRHSFEIPDPSDGQMWDGRVYGYHATDNNYRALDPPVFFYNLFVCSGARFTETDYLAGWCIFTDTWGLAAVGSTKTGSMTNYGAFYNPLGDGEMIGEAFRVWFATHGESSRPWHYGMAFIGDPTLRVSGKHTMTINTPGLASALGIVDYTEDGTAKTGDISGGTWSDDCDHGTTLSIDGVVTISGTERYSTTDTHSWAVAEPLTHTVNYYHQYKPTITTSGLPATATATVSYVQNGVAKTEPGIWDGNSFSDWCDAGSTVSIENPVMVSGGERYYSTDTTSWTVSSAFSAAVSYDHQFKVTCSVTTAGTGHEDLTAINHVTVDYVQSGSAMSEDIYDGHDLSDWMDAGTTYTFENPSSGSTSTHRWYTSSPTLYTVVSSTTTSLTYYEQFLMEVSSTGGFLTSTYKGTTNYLKFATPQMGHYWDGSPWSDWCDIGSTLTASQIVLGPANERYHTPGTVSWTVTESESYELPYHKEYKVTIKAEGLPDTLSTTVTIGTADPSPSDDVAGGDINDYILTLDSSSIPPFTWTNWVHADTDLTALDLITVSASEKYILVCWTKDGARLPPTTIYADTEGLTYSAQYAGIKKEMSLDEAELCSSITVTIEISNPPAGTATDTVYVVDDLPNEMSFVKGSAEVDGTAYTPDYEPIHVPEPPHERLTFTIDGSGKHTITFEVKVNRAYATDTTVENHVGATFDLIDVGEVPVDVLFEVTIHPYIGPTLSKAADGPEIVPLFTEESWVFTYIVKNNYDYEMAAPSLKDNFGAELVHDPDTVIANLLTEWEFPISRGRSEKVRLSWDLPNLAPGEAYKLQVTMSTGKTPSKHAQQEYTSPGVKVLNSGATLKWFDDADAKQSMETGSISVTAVE